MIGMRRTYLISMSILFEGEGREADKATTFHIPCSCRGAIHSASALRQLQVLLNSRSLSISSLVSVCLSAVTLLPSHMGGG